MKSDEQKMVELASFTNNLCKKDGYKCCSKDFCELAEKQALLLGYTPVKVNDKIPFLSDKGCTIPAEYRPGCSGFVCNHHLKGKCLMKYRKRHKRAFTPKYIHAMEIVRDEARNKMREKLKI